MPTIINEEEYSSNETHTKKKRKNLHYECEENGKYEANEKQMKPLGSIYNSLKVYVVFL